LQPCFVAQKDRRVVVGVVGVVVVGVVVVGVVVVGVVVGVGVVGVVGVGQQIIFSIIYNFLCK
jgi:hypothetical protein